MVVALATVVGYARAGVVPEALGRPTLGEIDVFIVQLLQLPAGYHICHLSHHHLRVAAP